MPKMLNMVELFNLHVSKDYNKGIKNAKKVQEKQSKQVTDIQITLNLYQSKQEDVY